MTIVIYVSDPQFVKISYCTLNWQSARPQVRILHIAAAASCSRTSRREAAVSHGCTMDMIFQYRQFVRYSCYLLYLYSLEITSLNICNNFIARSVCLNWHTLGMKWKILLEQNFYCLHCMHLLIAAGTI